jgi:hypothetical protein
VISKPQPDEIREAERSFYEVYETLTSFEKSTFHQIINFFKIQITKRDWALWLKKKNKGKLSEEKKKLRFIIQIILVFTLVALPAVFFTIAGDKIASFFVFFAIYFALFAGVVSSKNSIAMLEIEIDKIEVEILTIERIIKCTTTQSEINRFLDALFQCYESEGKFLAQESYMPFISLSIASMIKSSTYKLNEDYFF